MYTVLYMYFRLDQYNTSEFLVQAVRALQYLEGDTNTDLGIQTMRNELFTAQNGNVFCSVI